MPQLDKLSFATQYFWLTLFFFCLYFLTVNFFVILVFKNIKLRNIIYKIWYFFLYKFDYEEYHNRNKYTSANGFNAVYYVVYLNLVISAKINSFFSKIDLLLNKSFFLNLSISFLNDHNLTNYLTVDTRLVNVSEKLKNINIDEI